MLLVLYVLNALGIDSVSVFNSSSQIPTIVIDPGHGGHDCGAIGIDGTKESDINLSLSLKLQEIMELFGVKTVMTRIDDSPRTSYDNYSEHNELVYRTQLANAEGNALMISIHQNVFPHSDVSGFQVLYSDNDRSEMLGKALQKSVGDNLEPNNRRVAVPAPKKLYITANCRCPCILIECGFLTNQHDLDNLKDNTYQKKLALLIADTIFEYNNTAI